MIAIKEETELIEMVGENLCERCSGEIEETGVGLRQARGFPSPAENYVEGRLEIGQHLVRHPTATYFARMSGDGMEAAGIADGDLLVIDRSESIGNGHVIVIRVGEELLVRKLSIEEGRMRLIDDRTQPLALTPELDYEIWGRVIHSIRKH